MGIRKNPFAGDFCDICGQEPMNVASEVELVRKMRHFGQRPIRVPTGEGRIVRMGKETNDAWVCARCFYNLEDAKSYRIKGESYNNSYKKSDLKHAINAVKEDRAVARLKGIDLLWL